MSRRVKIIGGPWSERIGCEGVEVDAPQHARHRYPFAGRGSDETVVLLDADPLGSASLAGVPWTCVIRTSDLAFVGEARVGGAQ